MDVSNLNFPCLAVVHGLHEPAAVKKSKVGTQEKSLTNESQRGHS